MGGVGHQIAIMNNRFIIKMNSSIIHNECKATKTIINHCKLFINFLQYFHLFDVSLQSI